VVPRYCAHCGRPLAVAAAFCPACGGKVGAPVGAVLPSSAPGVGRDAGLPRTSGWATSAGLGPVRVRAQEVEAFRRLRWAAAVGLVGSLVGLGLAASPLSTGLVSFSSPSAGPILGSGAPAALAAVFGISVAFVLAEFVLLRMGFRRLAAHDGSFATPSSLALVAVVGLAVVAVGVGLFLEALARAIACVGAGSPLTVPCLANGWLWGSVPLLLVGGVAGLVGLVGVLVGVWRLGARYDDVAFKIAAVLLVLPILAIAGQLLLLVGISGQLRSGESSE
jgi:hypothetical protein